MSASNFSAAARVWALSPSLPRKRSYPATPSDHSTKFFSHAASSTYISVRSHVSAVLTFDRGGSVLPLRAGLAAVLRRALVTVLIGGEVTRGQRPSRGRDSALSVMLPTPSAPAAAAPGSSPGRRWRPPAPAPEQIPP